MLNHRPFAQGKLLKSLLHLCFVILLLSGLLALQPRPAHAATITVDSLLDPTDLGHTTLRDAITTANGTSGNTITFSVTGTIALKSTLPAITSNMTISGPGAAQLIIDGNNGGSPVQIMVVNSGATLNLSGVTLQNGQNNTGGGINNGGSLTISNSTFSNNSTPSGGVGGAIFNQSLGSAATVTISNSTFSNNSGGLGGAIFNQGFSAAATMTISNCKFSNNSTFAGGLGGAIFNQTFLSGVATMTISNSTFSNNSADQGGAMYNQGSATVTGSTFSSNSALSGDGGAIEGDSGSQTTVDSSTFSNNSTVGSGGAIISADTLTVTSSTFTGNSAVSTGGAITAAGSLDVRSSTFSNNSAPNGDGGGIENSGPAGTITNSTFFQNSAGAGGGINNDGTLTLNSVTLSQNAATGDGGGALSNNVTMTVTNTIAANSTQGGDCLVDFTSFVANGANLDSDGSCGSSSTNSNFSLQGKNPLLGPLQNNGGPTSTMALQTGSPAIDAAQSCTVATDQRGVSRPQGSACDLGAYEVGVLTASAPSGMCSVLGFPNTNLVRAVVPPGIATTGNIPVTICYGILTDPTQIGVLDRPITLAVEVVAYTQTQTPVSVAPLLQPITICLSGSGTLLYRDATGQPRVVTTLNAFSNGGYTCASIPDAGTVILVPGPAAPAGSIASAPSGGPSHALSACSIKTQDIVNLHVAADANSKVIAQIPTGTTLYATARAGDWIEVIYTNTQGWLAVRYLALDGQCN